MIFHIKIPLHHSSKIYHLQNDLFCFHQHKRIIYHDEHHRQHHHQRAINFSIIVIAFTFITFKIVRSMIIFHQHHYQHHHHHSKHICSSQPSMVHWLSSPIFPCSFVRLSRYGNTRPNLTSSCPTPQNPYIF